MDKKQRVNIEYVLFCPQALLFNSISSPEGLAEWFADNVNISGNIYTFFWQKDSQKAELISKKRDTLVRFRWLGDEYIGTFFELKIITSEFSNQLSLMITDFCEEDEKDETIELWNKSIAKLKRNLGIQ